MQVVSTLDELAGETIIDSRDIIAALADFDELEPDERTEELTALAAQARDMAEGVLPDWPYGETLIREDYFEEYARELADHRSNQCEPRLAAYVHRLDRCRRCLEGRLSRRRVWRIHVLRPAAVAEWDEIGAWPDHWSRWQRALDDVLPWHQSVDLRDL